MAEDEREKDEHSATFPDELTRDLESLAHPELAVESPARPSDFEILLARPPDPDVITKGLLDASKASSDELPATLAKVRALRRPGNAYRQNIQGLHVYDQVVVGLVQDGHEELATPLISSSPRDTENLRFTVGQEVGYDTPEATALLDKISAISEYKREQLAQTLSANGAPEAIARDLIMHASDPDAAIDIAPAQWEVIGRQPSWAREALEGSETPMVEIAGALVMIDEHDLSNGPPKLLDRVLALEAHDARSAFLNLYTQAADQVGRLRSEGRSVEEDAARNALADFADPVQAVTAGERFFEGDEPLDFNGLANLIRSRYYDKGPVQISDDYVDGLMTIKHTLAELSLDPSKLSDIADTLKKAESPDVQAAKIARTLKAGEIALKADPSNIYLLISTPDQDALAACLDILNPKFKEYPDDIGSVLHTISRIPDPAAAEHLRDAYAPLAARNLSFNDIEPLAVWNISPTGNTPEQTRAAVERLASDHFVRKEAISAYTAIHDGMAAGTLDAKALPHMDQFPEVQTRIAALGLTPQQSEELLGTWTSHSETRSFLYDKKRKSPSLTPEEHTSLVKKEALFMQKQLGYLETYGNTYGQSDLQEVVSTFNIRNFKRYAPEGLHAQNEQWKSGEKPSDDIVVSSRADWNGAMEQVGDHTKKQFAGETVWMFEANNAQEIGEALIAVGKHERAHGRQPNIKNVVIEAHANANGLLLGTSGQQLEVGDYIKAQAGRRLLADDQSKVTPRVQDYRRHIGPNARVILKACSAAGDNLGQVNIAQSISEGHNLPVDGSPFITSGSYVIEKDGSVTFTTATEGEVTGTHYPG